MLEIRSDCCRADITGNVGLSSDRNTCRKCGKECASKLVDESKASPKFHFVTDKIADITTSVTSFPVQTAAGQTKMQVVIVTYGLGKSGTLYKLENKDGNTAWEEVALSPNDEYLRIEEPLVSDQLERNK